MKIFNKNKEIIIKNINDLETFNNKYKLFINRNLNFNNFVFHSFNLVINLNEKKIFMSNKNNTLIYEVCSYE